MSGDQLPSPRANRLRDRSRSAVALGAWCAIPSASTAEFAAAAGPDYICIDCQHGLVDYSALVPMLQVLSRFSTTAVVRVGGHDPAMIGKVLDAGAEAVIVPMVEDSADAARIAAACRYPPLGTRSYGPTRASLLFGATVTSLSDHVLCLAMIETERGLLNAEEIVATPGIDGIYVGPSDLAISLGETPAPNLIPGKHADAVQHILDVCLAHGAIPGIHAYEGVVARGYIEMGFRMVTCAGDSRLVRDGVARELRAARAEPS